MGIETKSLSFLIDQLITVSHRCWDAQNLIMDESLSESARLQAAIRAQEQNAIRSQLMKAIDEMTGNGEFTMGGTKTYYSYFDREKKQ
jgi:molybdopterin biosynthesis enzyme MoaB